MKTIETLLAIQVYKLSGNEIGKLRDKSDKRDWIDDNLLPEYCINPEYNNVVKSANYLYWVDSGDEIYTLFTAHTSDLLLDNEISNVGLEDLLKGIKLQSYLDRCQIRGYDDLGRSIQSPNYLVIKLWFDSYDTPDGREYESGAELGGLLETLIYN